jgi:hypothetical protein
MERSMDTRLGNWDGGGSEALKVGRSPAGDQKRWQDQLKGGGGGARPRQGPGLVEGKLRFKFSCVNCSGCSISILTDRTFVPSRFVTAGGNHGKDTIGKGRAPLSHGGIPEENSENRGSNGPS